MMAPPIRRSTMTDPEIVAQYPWMPLLLDAFEKGDGDYRPRIPQYSLIQDALGTHVNAFLVGQETAEEALAAAQQQVEDNWQ
jgi:multiple sugar transport system substrate-binding protein